MGQGDEELQKLTAEAVLAIHATTERYILKWMSILGVANFLIIIGAAAYIFFILPDRAVKEAVATANREIDQKTDAAIEDSRSRLNEIVAGIIAQSDAQLQRIDSQLTVALERGVEIRTRTEDLADQSAQLKSQIVSAREILEQNDRALPRATEFLKAFSERPDAAGIDSRIASIESALITRNTAHVLVSDTQHGKSWPTESFASADYKLFWGPKEFYTKGGPLLVLFDASFTGSENGGARTWVRLMVDGVERRVVMKLSNSPWELDTLVLNELLLDLPVGKHFLQLDVKTESSNMQMPLKQPEKGDNASRKLIVIELPF